MFTLTNTVSNNQHKSFYYSHIVQGDHAVRDAFVKRKYEKSGIVKEDGSALGKLLVLGYSIWLFPL